MVRPPKYLKATKEVLDQRPGVGTDRHIAVELGKAGLGHLSPVFTDVLLPQVELQRGAREEGSGGRARGTGTPAREKKGCQEVPGRRGQPTGQCPGHAG